MTDQPLSPSDPMGQIERRDPRTNAPLCRATSKRSGELCRAAAVRGTDLCVDHAGVTIEEQRAKGEARLTLLAAASALGPVHPAETLLEANRIATIVMRRAADLVEAGSMEPAQLDVLGEWMDRAQRIAKATADADAADRWVRAQESVASRDADRVQELLAGVVTRLGHSWDDPEVRAAVTAALDDLGEGGK